jgi:hypothetical protein
MSRRSSDIEVQQHRTLQLSGWDCRWPWLLREGLQHRISGRPWPSKSAASRLWTPPPGSASYATPVAAPGSLPRCLCPKTASDEGRPYPLLRRIESRWAGFLDCSAAARTYNPKLPPRVMIDILYFTACEIVFNYPIRRQPHCRFSSHAVYHDVQAPS